MTRVANDGERTITRSTRSSRSTRSTRSSRSTRSAGDEADALVGRCELGCPFYSSQAIAFCSILPIDPRNRRSARNRRQKPSNAEHQISCKDTPRPPAAIPARDQHWDRVYGEEKCKDCAQEYVRNRQLARPPTTDPLARSLPHSDPLAVHLQRGRPTPPRRNSTVRRDTPSLAARLPRYICIYVSRAACYGPLVCRQVGQADCPGGPQRPPTPHQTHA